ncbi:portal protein [Agrobacterium rosae]|uniref:Portal protein n=1 Tax=Agrobacterium rosae TaxID=1972867 RepID=A0AAE5VMU8_9HYPH|nr:portal protein [Agrobacterium rosae]KAA3511605.1 portal protein [Agrobacterium rosae]KAA3518971.1 portal protein [Agrobacterium rosae]MQB49301.1 portal protein [Agrobacterium rosae]POO49143.1 portal protein [Agrobacterium rosae]
MDEQAIQNSIATKLKDAVNFSNSNIAAKNEQALKYYKRAYLPGDDKIKGRSKWVSPEVQQRVDWSVASMIRIFDSPENVCEFLPFGPEDEAISRQQTQIVNWTLKTKNSHLAFLQPWLQNGYICGLGIVTAEFTTETIEGLPRTFKGVPDANLVAFDQQEEAGQIVIESASKPYLNEAGISVRDLKIRNVRRNPVFNVLSVAPEDFIISRDAKIDPETGGIAAKLQGHRKIMSKSALLEMGYDADKVSQIAFASSKNDGIALERSKDLDGDQGVSGDDVEVFVVYCKMKIDKKARHYRFTLAGGIEKPVLLDYEEVSKFYPYAPFVPFPQADSLFSMGIADKIGDDHILITRLNRAILDDLHAHVHPTKIVNPDSVNLDDLLNIHPGSIVRSTDPTGGISYSIPPFSGSDAMPVIANISNGLDYSTGVGPQMSSLNASDLQNTTATAVNSRNSASQLLVEMVSRYFADTGYAYLIRIVIDQLVQKPEEAQEFIARLTNNFVPIDEFSPELDVTTSVSFGVMSRDQSTASLSNLLMQQMQAMQAGLPIVNAQTIYNTLAKLSETTGFKNSSLFFVDPSTLPPPPPPPPAIDPNQGLIDLETVKAQLKAQSDEADRQFEMQKLVAQLQQQQSEFKDQMELKTKQLEQDYLLKLMELDKKYTQQSEPRNDLSQLMIEVPDEQY